MQACVKRKFGTRQVPNVSEKPFECFGSEIDDDGLPARTPSYSPDVYRQANPDSNSDIGYQINSYSLIMPFEKWDLRVARNNHASLLI
jgi:hypothetical protein